MGTYQLDEINIYRTTVDADLEIVNEDGYDWIVITVKEFENWYGNLQLKITATGADHYADIDVIVKDLGIYKYEPENVTCPITSGSTVEAPTGTTVSELYATEEYAGLETKLGKWVLYMYVGVVEDNYFVDDVYDIDEVALTLKGTN